MSLGIARMAQDGPHGVGAHPEAAPLVEGQEASFSWQQSSQLACGDLASQCAFECQEPLCTPAEISLGQLLDALPDDSPWLARLERADEDFGRPIGDFLRLSRWTMVLVDMHYPNLWPDTRREWGKRLVDAVWEAYARHRGWRAA